MWKQMTQDFDMYREYWDHCDDKSRHLGHNYPDQSMIGGESRYEDEEFDNAMRHETPPPLQPIEKRTQDPYVSTLIPHSEQFDHEVLLEYAETMNHEESTIIVKEPVLTENSAEAIYNYLTEVFKHEEAELINLNEKESV